MRNLILNQNWICKNEKFWHFFAKSWLHCQVDELFSNATVYLSIELLESHGNSVILCFAKPNVANSRNFAKEASKKLFISLKLWANKAILNLHTRGHFLFHKINILQKHTKFLTSQIKSLEILLLFERHNFFKTTILGLQIHSVFEALQFFLSKWRFYAELCCDSLYAPTWNCIL